MACATVLFLSSASKIVALVQRLPLLFLVDPVFPFMSAKMLLLSIAIVELAVVNVILWHGDNALKLALILSLSCCFLIYRTATYVDTGHFLVIRCPCFGYVGDWLHISPIVMGTFSSMMTLFLLVSSAALLRLTRLQKFSAIT